MIDELFRYTVKITLLNVDLMFVQFEMIFKDLII